MHSVLLCLALVYLALSVIAQQPHKIPLYRRTENGVVEAAGKMLDSGILVGEIEIGTPPQKLTVAFDTTTGYSWVRGSRCKSENCLDRCTYYARRSQTVVSTGKKFSVEYGDACVDTHIYLDTVTFAGLTVENMPFGGAYRMSGFDHGFDGYLGLGRAVDFNHTKIHSSTGSLTRRDALSSSAFVPNAYQQGSGIQSAQFGIYVTTTGGNNGFGASGVANTGGTNQVATTVGTGATTTAGSTTVAAVTTTTAAAVATTAPATSPQTTTLPAGAAASPATTTSVTSGGFGFYKRNVEEPAGYLVIGGVDQSVIKGDVEYIRLSDSLDGSAKNWDVCIKDVNFGDTLSIKQKPLAVASISTASQYITLPCDQANIFQETFGLRYSESSKSYTVKCSEIKNLPPLKMTLEDHIVELPAHYWTYEVDSKRDCCSTYIRRGDSQRDWILGTAFTNAFYTTFDSENESIGLAIKKNQPDDGLRVYPKSH